MFDTVCHIPLTSDLFAQAIHPSYPLVASGLAAGHVEVYKLPAEDQGTEAGRKVNGFGMICTAWRTKRHKGSCRSLCFSNDGRALFSAGSDGLVKVADSDSGKVFGKIAIPENLYTGDLDAPSIIHALSPQTVLLATDSSALHLYDIRVDNSAFVKQKPQQTHHPHDDYISSLSAIPPTEASISGFSKQWATTGSSTVAITDLRRGVLSRSEDQEEELLSSVFVSGLSSRGSSKGEKLVVGCGGGVITLWERGVWDDQSDRIIVDRVRGEGETLDILALCPDDSGSGGTILAVGMGNGLVRFVKLGPNVVVDEVTHHEVDGVDGLGFDVGGRMVTGGGSFIKIWHESVEGDNQSMLDESRIEVEHEEEQEEEKEKDSSDDQARKKRKRRRKKGNAEKKEGNGQGSMAFHDLD